MPRPYCALACLVLVCFGFGTGVELGSSAALYAQESELQEFLKQTVSNYEVPAMWAGRYQVANHRITEASYTASFGVRKFGEPTEVTEADTIHLGSCTKAMTAVLIAQLISEGKLGWESTLGEIFAEDSQVVDSGWAGVTVSDLLEHQSGAPANASWFLIEREHRADVVAGRRAVLHWMVSKAPPRKPRYLYSNVGFCLLGHIAEQLEGKSWESLIQERVFAPLEMNSVGFGPVLAPEKVKTAALSQPWGHVVDSGNLLASVLGGKTSWQANQVDNAIPLGPAGRCHMPLSDWAKFVALFAGDNGPDPRLRIKPKDWQRLLQPQREGGNYAGGWILAERGWADGLVLNHAGSNTTWFCVAWVAPKKDFFALVACNAMGGKVSKACDEVAAKLVTAKH